MGVHSPQDCSVSSHACATLPCCSVVVFVPRAGLFSDWLGDVWDMYLCFSSSAAGLI